MAPAAPAPAPGLLDPSRNPALATPLAQPLLAALRDLYSGEPVGGLGGTSAGLTPALEAVGGLGAEELRSRRCPHGTRTGFIPGLEPDRLFWFAGERELPALAGALHALTDAAAHGLEPGDYDAAGLTRTWRAIGQSGTHADREHFDVALSLAVMRLLQDVHRGRVDPRRVGFDYDVSSKRLDLPAMLRSARDAGSLAGAIAAAEPRFPGHRRLLAALTRYRRLASSPPLARLPALGDGRRKLEPGQPWFGASALAARLRAFGDLPNGARTFARGTDGGLGAEEGRLRRSPQGTGAGFTPASEPDGTPVYGGALVEAVKRFQGRHALEPDGVLGLATLEALEVTPAARARQIELALERERWLPVLGTDRVILVNVALFRLWAIDPAQPGEPLRVKVVVGKALGHETPIFVARLERTIFRPYWHPPPSIVRGEILPQVRDDPLYLEHEQMEIVASADPLAPELPATPENLAAVSAGRLTLRQRPGPRNSLGLVKFLFPNAQDVYMHGTPAPALFARARRDFSHGCIRVEDPTSLAEWVLRDTPGWGRERIEAAMRGSQPAHVNLKVPVNVFIFYDTVYVEPDGLVHFAPDLYGHDARLDAVLRLPPRER